MGTRAVGGLPSEPATSSKPRGAPIRRSKLRIGVLPFLAIDESKDANLATAAADSVAAALREFRWLDVVFAESPSHNCSAPRGNLGRAQSDLVEYIVEGAISGDGNRAHVSIRLVDLEDCARTLVNERFVVTAAKLSSWSKLLAAHIVAGIDPVTSFFDGRPQRRLRSGANELLLAAIPLMSSMERRKFEEAGRLIDRALDFEPDNAQAAAWAAFWQVLYFGQGWTQNFMKASAIAQVRARRAISQNPGDALTLAICGHVSSFLGRDYDTALYYFDRAQRVDPALEFHWLWSALTYCYAGKPGDALERLGQYRALTSIEPSHAWVTNIYAVANLFAGNYEKAVASGSRGVKMSPGFVNAYKPLIASLGHLGRVEEAKPYVDKLLALEPNFTVERFRQVYPIKYDSDREHYMKGLRLAGVPER
jgi:tetratricopeptide (TPR) repeat protein/TolB-like protein